MRTTPESVIGKRLSVTGFVVGLYRPNEPAGEAGCIYPTKAHLPTTIKPVPDKCTIHLTERLHFWVADDPHETDRTKMIVVLGYASTFIQQWFARKYYQERPEALISESEDDKYLDNNSSQIIHILGEPAVGAKVRVTGELGVVQVTQFKTFEFPDGRLDVGWAHQGHIEYLVGTEQIPEPS